MLTPPSGNDPADWHRYFGMLYNNHAWTLSEARREEAEDREMLDAAHAAAQHWAAVGTERHRMRATLLLAQVHALVGHGATALAYAAEMHAYFMHENGASWETALAHTVYAHAAHAAGKREEYRAAYTRAMTTLGMVDDPEERQIVQATFDTVPKP